MRAIINVVIIALSASVCTTASARATKLKPDVVDFYCTTIPYGSSKKLKEINMHVYEAIKTLPIEQQITFLKKADRMSPYEKIQLRCA